MESKLTNKVKIFGEMIVERRGLSPGRGQGRRKQGRRKLLRITVIEGDCGEKSRIFRYF